MITAIKLFFTGLNLTSIKNYALITAVILIAFIGLLWQLEKAHHRATTSEYALFTAKTKALGEIQQAKNKAELEKRQIIANNAIKSYEAKIKEVHKYYEANPTLRYITIKRLPSNNSSRGGMSTKSESTASTNAGLDGVEEATATVDLQKAGQEVVQCLELIEFTKQQDAVK